MEINELKKGHGIIVRIEWGKTEIEFDSAVEGSDDKGILIRPYKRGGNEIDMTVHAGHDIVCGIYTDSPKDGTRISWRNVNLKTVGHNGKKLYHVTTDSFNRQGKNSERRDHKRININHEGIIWNESLMEYSKVVVHDISDNGISFYVSKQKAPVTGKINLKFSGNVSGEEFNFDLDCAVVHIEDRNGLMHYGCEIRNAHHEYQLYRCLLRLRNFDPSAKAQEAADVERALERARTLQQQAEN